MNDLEVVIYLISGKTLGNVDPIPLSQIKGFLHLLPDLSESF